MNLHELLHTHLKRARLPFRHLGNLQRLVFLPTLAVLTCLCTISPACNSCAVSTAGRPPRQSIKVRYCYQIYLINLFVYHFARLQQLCCKHCGQATSAYLTCRSNYTTPSMILNFSDFYLLRTCTKIQVVSYHHDSNCS